MNARLDLLRILANNAVGEKSLGERFIALVNRIPGVYGERNKMVHGIWKRAEQPGAARRYVLRARGKRVTGSIDNFKAEAIWDVFEMITDLLLELLSLSDELGVQSSMESAPKHSKTART